MSGPQLRFETKEIILKFDPVDIFCFASQSSSIRTKTVSPGETRPTAFFWRDLRNGVIRADTRPSETETR